MTGSKTTVKRSSRSSPPADLLLGGDRHQRVRVVDEEEVDRVLPGRRQRVAEEVHVDEARRGLGGRGARRSVDVPPGGRIGHRVAAAPHAELPGHRRQREDRGRRGAAVAAALLAPAAAQGRRRGSGVEDGEALDVLRRDPRLGRGPLERPRRGPALELLGARGVRFEELPVGLSGGEEPPDHGEGDRAGRCPAEERGEGRRARPSAYGAGRRPRACRPASAPPGCTGARWIPEAAGLTPQRTMSSRAGVVRIGDSGHLPVEAGVGGRRRRRADRARQPRGAQSTEQARVGRVLREIAVRSAVRERAGCPLPRGCRGCPCIFAATSVRASSHETRSNRPSPLRPVSDARDEAGARPRTCVSGTRAPWRRCNPASPGWSATLRSRRRDRPRR